MTLETIVLAVGPNDDERVDALARTTGDIAEPAGAEVAVVHVFDRTEYEEILARLQIESEDERTPDVVARRREAVRDLESTLSGRGIDVTVTGRLGDHGDEIVEFTDAVSADLVVVGGRRRSPTGKAILGSTAQRVLLDAPAPVTFVRVDGR